VNGFPGHLSDKDLMLINTGTAILISGMAEMDNGPLFDAITDRSCEFR
jgi:hypothetical protein